MEKYNNAVVFLTVPACCPPTGEEKERFEETLRRHLGYDDMLFGIITHESKEQDIKATLLLNHRLLAQGSNNK